MRRCKLVSGIEFFNRVIDVQSLKIYQQFTWQSVFLGGHKHGMKGIAAGEPILSNTLTM